MHDRGSVASPLPSILTPSSLSAYIPHPVALIDQQTARLAKTVLKSTVLTGTRMGPPNPEQDAGKPGQPPKGKFHSSERQKLLPDPAAKRGRLSFPRYTELHLEPGELCQ